MKKLLITSLTLACTAASFALSLDDLTYYGTGSNRAALVIDFKNSGPAYVWGFRFDGSITGQQMVQAVAAADPLLDLEITSYSFGDAITGISYGSNNLAGFNSGTPGYWSYYLADAAPALTSWTESQVGMSARTVTNNSWDGWSWAANFNASAPTTTNLQAVPEPATMAALGLGVFGLLKRRGKKSS